MAVSLVVLLLLSTWLLAVQWQFHKALVESVLQTEAWFLICWSYSPTTHFILLKKTTPSFVESEVLIQM